MRTPMSLMTGCVDMMQEGLEAFGQMMYKR